LENWQQLQNSGWVMFVIRGFGEYLFMTVYTFALHASFLYSSFSIPGTTHFWHYLGCREDLCVRK